MTHRFISVVGMLALLMVANGIAAPGPPQIPSTWSFRAECIEACSCALFCPCYWNKAPDKDLCQFNIAARVKQGHYGDTRLDGLKFWMTGDFGADFSDGETKVVQFAFEPSATHEQVDALLAILSEIYPFHWRRIVGIQRTSIEWKKENLQARAERGDGKGKIMMTFVKGNDGKTPVVINNLTYFGAKKNYGFYLARANHHAKVGADSFTFDGVTGFYIEVESSGAVDQ